MVDRNETNRLMMLALEFGFKQCEKGNNLEMAIRNYYDLLNPDRPDIPRAVVGMGPKKGD